VIWNSLRTHKYEILLILLFIIATGLRLNLNGMPLTHPGNIKAADPFYHSLTADMIIESNQWRYNPYYVSFGEEKSINQQPPLAYIQTAGVSMLTGLPSWLVVYFIVALFAGIRTLLIYAISKEFFNNKNISIIAAALSVLPIEPRAWLYEVYIGFWIQVIALTILLGIGWCVLRYSRTNESWLLWIIGISSAGLIMTHPQEILFLPLIFSFLAYQIFNAKQSIKETVKNLLRLCVLPALCLLVMLSWFLYVWKGKGYSLAINLEPFPQSYLGGITTPGLSFFPTWYLLIAGLGTVLAIIWWKTHKQVIVFTGYYGFFTFVLPYFLVSPYYLGRTKTLLPLILAPFAALAIHFIISTIEKTTRKHFTRFIVFGLIAVLVVGAGIPAYQELTRSLRGEHIDYAKWNAFKWIHNSTPEDSTILFLEDCDQASCIYTKRITAYIEQKDLPAQAQSILKTHELSNASTLSWAADTLWDYPTQEQSLFVFTKLDKEKLKKKYSQLTDFNYIYLRNYNKELAQFHQQLIQALGSNYSLAYNTGGIIILQHA